MSYCLFSSCSRDIKGDETEETLWSQSGSIHSPTNVLSLLKSQSAKRKPLYPNSSWAFLSVFGLMDRQKALELSQDLLRCENLWILEEISLPFSWRQSCNAQTAAVSWPWSSRKSCSAPRISFFCAAARKKSTFLTVCFRDAGVGLARGSVLRFFAPNFPQMALDPRSRITVEFRVESGCVSGFFLEHLSLGLSYYL